MVILYDAIKTIQNGFFCFSLKKKFLLKKKPEKHSLKKTRWFFFKKGFRNPGFYAIFNINFQKFSTPFPEFFQTLSRINFSKLSNQIK